MLPYPYPTFRLREISMHVGIGRVLVPVPVPKSPETRDEADCVCVVVISQGWEDVSFPMRTCRRFILSARYISRTVRVFVDGDFTRAPEL